jgi:branched-chain amino acid transport system permease protein
MPDTYRTKVIAFTLSALLGGLGGGLFAGGFTYISPERRVHLSAQHLVRYFSFCFLSGFAS